MDFTPDIPVLAESQRRRRRTTRTPRSPRQGGEAAASGQPIDQRLRLVRRPDTPVARHADAVEAAFAAHYTQMVASLDELERDLDDVESERGRGAHEQVSFIRVGLRCLADAIGELHAHIADLPASEPGDRPPKGPGGGAA